MHLLFRIKEGNPNHWEILVDGQKWREVHRSIFGRKPAFPSCAVEEDLQTVFNDYEYQRTKSYVLWRLSHQSYHSEQLAKLLRERLVQGHTIDRILQEYQKMGFLNDAAWLEDFMRGQQKRFSLRLILAKLHAKGLSAETVQSLARDWKNPDAELQAIQHLIRTRYRSKDLTQYPLRQKVIAALIRKGYAFDQIQLALRLSQEESPF